MLAFENGALNPAKFADRLAELDAKAHALRARQAALTADTGIEPTYLPTAAELRRLARWLRDVSRAGLAAEHKAIAQAFVHELVVQARDRVQPTFKIRPPLPQDEALSVGPNPDGTGVRAVTSYVYVT